MASAVRELQQGALDRGVPLSDLLRRAYVIARKLGLEEFQEWVQQELNGYDLTADIPEYRVVRGTVRGWNPYRGWLPVIFEDPREAELLSKRAVGQSIAELESLLESKDRGQLHIPLPHAHQRDLSESAGFATQFTLFTPATSVAGVLDAIRNVLLNWSLQLEEDGIVGEGLTFSKEEKAAVNPGSYNINNFFGEVGSAHVQQAGRDAVRVTIDLDLNGAAAFIRDLKAQLADLDLKKDEFAEISAEIATAEAQLGSPKPKRDVIREALLSMRSVLEGAGGGAAAHLLIKLGQLVAGG